MYIEKTRRIGEVSWCCSTHRDDVVILAVVRGKKVIWIKMIYSKSGRLTNNYQISREEAWLTLVDWEVIK